MCFLGDVPFDALTERLFQVGVSYSNALTDEQWGVLYDTPVSLQVSEVSIFKVGAYTRSHALMHTYAQTTQHIARI